MMITDKERRELHAWIKDEHKPTTTRGTLPMNVELRWIS